MGRPPEKPKAFSHAFRDRAKSWDQAGRVVAKVEWHAGELFPRDTAAVRTAALSAFTSELLRRIDASKAA